MRISLIKVVKVDDIEIEFSISSTTVLKPLIIRAFTVFPKGGVINHIEPFYKKRKKDTIIKTFEERQETYIKQILKAKEDYDNRRTQGTRNKKNSR